MASSSIFSAKSPKTSHTALGGVEEYIFCAFVAEIVEYNPFFAKTMEFTHDHGTSPTTEDNRPRTMGTYQRPLQITQHHGTPWQITQHNGNSPKVVATHPKQCKSPKPMDNYTKPWTIMEYDSCNSQL